MRPSALRTQQRPLVALEKNQTSSKYKKFIENCFKLLQGQALHAKTLGFQHPSKDEYLRLNSELSEGFGKVIDKWEKYTYVD